MHLLSANRAASAERWLRIPKWQRGLRIAWAVVRAIVPTPARVLRSASTIGKGCHIHPTAVIEGATLGDGVRVGANAVIRFSRVGDGGFIMDGANVSFSTLGDHCVVGTHCVVGFCLLHDGASAAQNLMQMCVLGRKAITTGLSGSVDMNLGEGSVAVLDQGKVVSSEQRFLGGAIGHDAVIGSGVWIAHGREIPNGYIVVRAPEAILYKVPTDLPAGEALAVVNGTLEKI
jgi:NDP-sugar pyrophosphorylase family protein